MRPVPSGVTVRGAVRVPPSKSVTHRHLTLALLAGRPFLLRRPLIADDIRRYLGVFRALGWRVTEADAAVSLQPPERPVAEATFDCGAAGTLLRLLVAAAATLPGRWTLDGTPRLRERPIGPLVEALRPLGVQVAWRGTPGHPPVEVTGPTFGGGATTVDAGESSQYLSAILLTALKAPEPTEVRVTALTSAPYVEVTLGVIAGWGGRVERHGDVYRVSPARLALAEATVEGDWSAASYPAAAAAVTAGRVDLLGLDPESRQGDRGFLDVLAAMGARVETAPDRVTVEGPSRLRAVEADMAAMPDLVPTMAAVAPFAAGLTRISGVAHLRLKESDRLAAMAGELRRLGVPARETADGLEVPGVWAEAPPPSDPVTVESWDDHRIAMSLAVLGLRRPGVSVRDPAVVAKSYPGFWEDLACTISPPTPPP